MAKHFGNGTVAREGGEFLVIGLGKSYEGADRKFLADVMFLGGGQEGKTGTVALGDLEPVSKEEVAEGRRLAEALGWKKDEQSEEQPRQQRSTTNDAPEDNEKDLVLQVGGYKITLYPRKSREDGETSPVGIEIEHRGATVASAEVRMKLSIRRVRSSVDEDVDTGVRTAKVSYVIDVSDVSGAADGDVAKK